MYVTAEQELEHKRMGLRFLRPENDTAPFELLVYTPACGEFNSFAAPHQRVKRSNESRRKQGLELQVFDRSFPRGFLLPHRYIHRIFISTCFHITTMDILSTEPMNNTNISTFFLLQNLSSTKSINVSDEVREMDSSYKFIYKMKQIFRLN